MLEALFQVQTFRPFELVPPANYRVFLYVSPIAVLLDFNTDGQLRKYCEPPHLILNPHGVIDRLILERPEIDQLLRYAAYGVRITSTWVWFPGPEPSTITRGSDYDLAARSLRKPGDFFLLIGYSFGRQPSGSIDDAESFEFLRELLKRFRRRVVVLDPSPELVAGLFEDALRQRIYACKLYWNHLAESACAAMIEAPAARSLYAVRHRVARLYEEQTR